MLTGKGIYQGGEWPQSQPVERPQEKVHLSHTIKIERKSFNFKMRENGVGKFLRITELAGDHRDTIIVPESGLKDFIAGVQKVSAL